MLWLALAACSSPPAARQVAEHPPSARSSAGPEGPPASVVDCAGGGDFTTIQAAIDAAPRDGWIQVEPCTYAEKLDLKGKSLWVASTGGSKATFLDPALGAGISAVSGETDGAALVGFTITRGDPAVHVRHSALHLQDVVLSQSAGPFAIQSDGSDLELDGVVVDSTNATTESVLFKDRGGLSITHSTFTCGAASVGLDLDHGSTFIDWSTVNCPLEKAINYHHDVGRLQRSTVYGDIHLESEFDHFTDRVAVQDSLVFGSIDVQWGTFLFANSISTGEIELTDVADTATVTSSVFLGAGGCALTSNVPFNVEYTDFWGTDSICDGPEVTDIDGNFIADPKFANAPFDYSPGVGSPLIDAGDPDARALDVDGTRNDVGITGSHWSVRGGW
jgi:hypothetical protein